MAEFDNVVEIYEKESDQFFRKISEGHFIVNKLHTVIFVIRSKILYDTRKYQTLYFATPNIKRFIPFVDISKIKNNYHIFDIGPLQYLGDLTKEGLAYFRALTGDIEYKMQKNGFYEAYWNFQKWKIRLNIPIEHIGNGKFHLRLKHFTTGNPVVSCAVKIDSIHVKEYTSQIDKVTEKYGECILLLKRKIPGDKVMSVCYLKTPNAVADEFHGIPIMTQQQPLSIGVFTGLNVALYTPRIFTILPFSRQKWNNYEFENDFGDFIQSLDFLAKPDVEIIYPGVLKQLTSDVSMIVRGIDGEKYILVKGNSPQKTIKKTSY